MARSVSSFGMARTTTSSSSSSSTTQLQMGLFDGVKEAFSAPPSSTLDAERETPIDRWMGWNVKKEEEVALSVAVYYTYSNTRHHYYLNLMCRP
eukprot:scaffold7097_cov60-Attheya_sp.AAC.3